MAEEKKEQWSAEVSGGGVFFHSHNSVCRFRRKTLAIIAVRLHRAYHDLVLVGDSDKDLRTRNDSVNIAHSSRPPWRNQYQKSRLI